MTADTATQAPPSRGWLLAVATVVAAALAVRLLFLGDKALWLDEAYSVWFSAQSWHTLWREVPRFETHPPLYYSLLKIWRGPDSSEAVLRLPSALANAATVGLVALTASFAAPARRKLPLAAAAALLFAASPLQLSLAQEARPYALLMLGLGVALTCASWIVAHPQRAGRPLWPRGRGDFCTTAAFSGLGLGTAAVLWLHNLGIVFAAALGAILIAWWSVQRGNRGILFVNLLATALFTLVLYAPNLPTLLLQLQSVSEQFWLVAPSPAALSRLIFQVYGQWQQLYKHTFQQLGIQLMLAVPLAVLGIKATWRLRAESRWTAWLLLATAFGPLLLMLALSYTVQPVLLDRTLAPVQLPWAVICAAAPFAVGPQRRPLVWGMIAAICLLNTAGFVVDQATAARRDAARPWRIIAQRIAASDAADAPVVIVPNSSALALGYYDAALGTALAIHPLPAAYPARGNAYRYPAGGQVVPGIDDKVLPLLAEATAEASTVWLITRLEPVFDPQRIVRRALAARFPCAEQIIYGLIAVTRFDGAHRCG